MCNCKHNINTVSKDYDFNLICLNLCLIIGSIKQKSEVNNNKFIFKN